MSARTPPEGIKAPEVDLVRLARARGELAAKEKEIKDAEATAKWRAEEARRLALQQAAPDLLAACKALLAVVAIQNGNLHADTNEIQDDARAAIAKAEGR